MVEPYGWGLSVSNTGENQLSAVSYEAGTSAPTLDVLRNLALALNITTDELIFGNDERGPDTDLRLAFEGANRQLDPDEQRTIRDVIEALPLKHDARRWTNAS